MKFAMAKHTSETASAGKDSLLLKLPNFVSGAFLNRVYKVHPNSTVLCLPVFIKAGAAAQQVFSTANLSV